MNNCKVSIYLAYMMCIYCTTSLYYIVRSKSVGTPFNDSLTPEQQIIKKESTKVRKAIFVEGIFLSIFVMLFAKPFKNCV